MKHLGKFNQSFFFFKFKKTKTYQKLRFKNLILKFFVFRKNKKKSECFYVQGTLFFRLFMVYFINGGIYSCNIKYSTCNLHAWEIWIFYCIQNNMRRQSSSITSTRLLFFRVMMLYMLPAPTYIIYAFVMAMVSYV